MKTVKQYILYGSLIFSLLLFTYPTKAQNPISYHSGEIIHIAVTFSGPGADKIISVDAALQTSKATNPNDQPNFSTSIRVNSGKKVGENTFELDFPIVDGQASGEYRMEWLNATAKVGESGQVSFGYNGDDLHKVTVVIENSHTAKQPAIKVTVLPKP